MPGDDVGVRSGGGRDIGSTLFRWIGFQLRVHGTGGDAGQRNGQGVGAIFSLDFRRHRHAGTEGRFLFVDADPHLKLRGLLRLTAAAAAATGRTAHTGTQGGIGHSGHHPGEFPVFEGVHFQPGLLPRHDAHHVHFPHIHARFNLVQIRDGHDGGTGVLNRAQNALAHLGIQAGDGAGERRNDGGFGQLFLRAVHCALATLT